MSKKRKKALLSQGLSYLVLILVLAFVALQVNWSKVDYEFFNRATMKEMWPDVFLTAAINTIKFTAISFVGGLLLAFILAIMRLSPVAPYRWFATAFVEFFRGLPALVVIILFGLGVPLAFQGSPQVPGGPPVGGFKWPEFDWLGPAPLTGGLIGLTFVCSAYMAETLRAGIQAVPKGQTEAARSLGMSGTRTMFTIVLPQAIRVVIPPLTNEFVLLLKDTALLGGVLGTTATSLDLTEYARTAMTGAGNPTPLIMAALFYLIISIPITQLVSWMERRQQKAR